jgi:hypothetical protein
MAEIFISYARVDRERAQALAGALDREGWSIWWDRDIPPGRTFDDVIEEALTAAKCVIVLWSSESVRSEWVKAEASDAARRRILVPVVVDNVMPPLEFRRIQSAALPEWESPTSNPDWSHLCRSIGTLVGRPPVSASNTPATLDEPPGDAGGVLKNRPNAWTLTAGVLSACAIVVLGGLAWVVLSGPFHSEPSGAVASVIDSQSVPIHPSAPEPTVPAPERVEPPSRELLAAAEAGLSRELVAAAEALAPRVTRPRREPPGATRDPGPDARNVVDLKRALDAVALSAGVAPAAPNPTLLSGEGIADGGRVPMPVASPLRAQSPASFDVAYTRGVFRESGRLTISPDGLRYAESGGRSSVDAACGDVREVHLPTVIVDGEQRMVELRLRDRVLRFTTASTAARNQFVSALSQACGTR